MSEKQLNDAQSILSMLDAENSKNAFSVKSVNDLKPEIDKHRKGQLIEPVSTGIDKIDPHFNFFWGMLVIFTGYPQSGKSEILRFFAMMFIRRSVKVAFFSPESFSAALADELIISLADQERNAQNQNKYEACEAWVNDYASFIEIKDDIGMPNVDQLIGQMKSLVSEGVRFFVIDPLNWVTTSSYGLMMVEAIRLVLTRLKQFAKRHKVIIAYVEHPKTPNPNKDGEYPDANVFMVNGGVMHNNKVDAAIIMHRRKSTDENNNPISSNADQILFEVGKLKYQKYLGHPAIIPLQYDYQTGNYY